MSTALADLFSGSSPPPQPTTPPRSPSPGQRDPLFFSPGDTPNRSTQQPQSSTSRSRLPSPPRRISYNDEDRQRASGIQIAEVPRSGSLPPFDDPLAGLGLDNADGDDGEQPAKKRRVMAKIDQDRLMGERGFPALMKAAKKFKSKGKGHEAQDLRDLLGMYQLWAHGMFPKGDFGSTIARVETICRTRRMEIAMKGYREAFYPPVDRSPSPPGLSPLHTSPPQHQSSPLPDNEEGGRTGSVPLFDNPEEPDMEELIAMEEMEREERNATTQRARDGEGDDGPPPPLDEEDEWEGLYD